MTTEDSVELETVNHKGRTALLFGLVSGLILGVVLYLCLR